MWCIAASFISTTLKITISKVIISTATIRNTIFKCNTVIPLIAFDLTIINTQIWIKDYVFSIYTCFREVLITIFYMSVTSMYILLDLKPYMSPTLIKIMSLPEVLVVVVVVVVVVAEKRRCSSISSNTSFYDNKAAKEYKLCRSYRHIA